LVGCQSPEKLSLMSNEKRCGLRVHLWDQENKWAELTRRGFSKNCKNEIELPKICDEAAGLQKGTPAYADCVIKVTISQKERDNLRKATFTQCVTACVTKGRYRFYCEDSCSR